MKLGKKPQLLLIAGTRPEAIKVAPIALELGKSEKLNYALLDTGQHRDMIKSALEAFGIQAHIQTEFRRDRGSLLELASQLFASLEEILSSKKFDGVLVQGDTLSAGIAAQAAFFMKLPVFHVEAGLRSYDLENPFPEEGIRRIISQIANKHYCPTKQAKDNLASEGVDCSKIMVTGNTVVDAVCLLTEKIDDINFREIEGLQDYRPDSNHFRILVTCHRRENHGENLNNVINAIEYICERIKDARVIFPVHPNPNVKLHVQERLSSFENVYLTHPLPYLHLLKIIKSSQIIITDSGGIQEEAPSFGADLLIIRKVTERPEVLQYPLAKLIGTDTDVIVNSVAESYIRRKEKGDCGTFKNPFGDGNAAERIVMDIENYFEQA